MEIIQTLLDFILHIDVHLTQLVADYGTGVYIILFLILFCETGLVVTPFLPGDSLLFVAGALCALPDNSLSVHVMSALLVCAAVCGDSSNYFIGRFLGERLFRNPQSKVFKQAYLDRTHAFYARHGGKTVVLARFFPIIRTFSPFVAGMGKMDYRYFLTCSVLGGLFWVCLFLYLGYFLGTLPFVQANLKFLMIAIVLFSLFPIGIEFLRTRLQKRS